jgi:hypothetical protein
MTSARERILARVRTALSTPAERPPAGTEQRVFPPVTDLACRFREELLALRGELLEQEQDLRAFLAGFDRIATDGSDLVRETVGARECDTRTADLGVTSCDFVIAQLGAIVVTASSAGGRALSVLPPVHLVIARRSQLVPDLAAALEGLRGRYQGRWPSALSIIAGPSRTGDIEKVLGAHGPRRLVVWLTD